MNRQKNMCEEIQVPIPDPWRKEYPHYIANRTILRILNVFVLLLCIATFFSYGYYSYYINLEKQQKISNVVLNEDDGWSCVSLTEWSGEYRFIKDDYIGGISNKLRNHNTSWAAYMSRVTAQDANGDEITFYTNTDDASQFTDSIHQVADWDIDGASSIGTLDDCQEYWNQRFCSNVTSDDGGWAKITTTTQYVLTYWANETYDIFPNLNTFELIDTRHADSPTLGFNQWNTSSTSRPYATFVVFTDLPNACTDYFDLAGVDPDVDACFTDYFPGNTYCVSNDSDIVQYVSCEVWETDVCMLNAATIFNQSDVGVIWESSSYIDYLVSALVMADTWQNGGEYDTCDDYWNDVCSENIIEDWCEEIYQPPYQCEREIKRDLLDVLALAYAQTEFVSTILLVIIGFTLGKLCKCCVKKDDSEPEKTLELHTAYTGSIDNDNDQIVGKIAAMQKKMEDLEAEISLLKKDRKRGETVEMVMTNE